MPKDLWEVCSAVSAALDEVEDGKLADAIILTYERRWEDESDVVGHLRILRDRINGRVLAA